MKDKFDRFDEWLQGHEQLSKTTARKAVSDVRTMFAHGTTPPASKMLASRLKDYRYAWALFADFCEAEGTPCGLAEPPRPPPPPPSHRARRKKREPKRLQEAVSIPFELWRGFVKIVEQDKTPAGRVIDVLCGTSLRISDVLRTDKRTLREGFARADGLCTITVKGGKDVIYSIRGAEEQWTQLLELMKPPRIVKADQIVAEVVSKGSDWTATSAAYKQCWRTLRALAEKAGLEDRVHLHRLRRTVAVQLANTTGNKWLVQKALSHDDSSTTDGYLDESNAVEVAKALAEYNRRVRG